MVDRDVALGRGQRQPGSLRQCRQSLDERRSYGDGVDKELRDVARALVHALPELGGGGGEALQRGHRHGQRLQGPAFCLLDEVKDRRVDSMKHVVACSHHLREVRSGHGIPAAVSLAHAQENGVAHGLGVRAHRGCETGTVGSSV